VFTSTYILATAMGRRDANVVSASMRRVRSRDTGPELALRKALWKRGLRYRLYAKKLPGKPDIVFARARIAVFVDGDFWHGNQWQLRGLDRLEDQFEGNANADYWVPKIRRTMIRDSDNTARLEYDGWQVLRFWESEVAKDLESCVTRIALAVTKRTER
jgi:DNA mismatch endonuclease (patch repair protein)